MSGSWHLAGGPWALLAGVLFLAGLAALSVAHLRRETVSRRLVASEIVKLLAAVLLALTVAKPEYVRETVREQRPEVAVLLDRSASMQTRDVMTNRTARAVSREAWLNERHDARFWEPLAERYDVTVHDFGAAPSNAAPETAGTDLNAALEETLEAHGQLRAVLLLSDGDWNQGRSPVGAATRLRLAGASVFAVATGAGDYLPDLALQDVAAPSYGLLEERISIPFAIRSHMPRDVETRITLTGTDGTRDTRRVTVPARGELRDAFMIEPSTAGTFEYAVEVERQEGESLADNNRRTFSMALRREILRVLVIESLPRWEYRYLRNALTRDPGVRVDCLLLHPGMAPAQGPGYLERFPATRAELSAYDVVFLGDLGVAEGELTAEETERIAALVRYEGSGLVFLPGPRGGQATLDDTPLAELMPAFRSEGSRAGSAGEWPSRFRLTAPGRDHLLTMLGATPTQNQGIWSRLPGFYWHADILRPKLGARVLAVHDAARNRHGRVPMLVTRDSGAGKVLLMASDEVWRWRKGVEDRYHYRFWGQVVRWMAHKRHLASGDGLRFFYAPETPRKGEQVLITATAFDTSGYPLREGTVRVTVVTPSGSTHVMSLGAEPENAGTFTGAYVPREAGAHEVRVRCEETGRETDTEVQVTAPPLEIIGRPARPSVLAEVASLTGGRSGPVDALPDLVAAIRLLPEAERLVRRLPLWNHPAWLALLAAAWSAYWVLRKLAGRV